MKEDPKCSDEVDIYFEMSTESQTLLERARRELLDLSGRNRLLSVPVTSRTTRMLFMDEPRAAEVFHHLVIERRTLSFAGGTEGADSPGTGTEDPSAAPPEPLEAEQAVNGASGADVDESAEAESLPAASDAADLHRTEADAPPEIADSDVSERSPDQPCDPEGEMGSEQRDLTAPEGSLMDSEQSVGSHKETDAANVSDEAPSQPPQESIPEAIESELSPPLARGSAPRRASGTAPSVSREPSRRVSRLQTTLTPSMLQRRLLALSRDALTSIEETGVNVLYLAVGLLKWIDKDDRNAVRHAPLILVPVELQRRTAAARFQMRAREEDIEENLSLRIKLAADFNLELPEFPDSEVFDVEAYLASVNDRISGLEDWEVLPHTLCLGFFSFTKLLMYRDLDPASWPSGRNLLSNPLIESLLSRGFPQPEDPLSEDCPLDERIPVEKLDHVVDADSSQTLAIEQVRRGASLVIQGPPGTGKSQSITNIIATAVLEGKRVLFVAEKLAALEVVFRRLDREGLGDLCLQIHSNRANKRAVLEEIGRTWRLGRPKQKNADRILQRLKARRDELNAHCDRLHAAHGTTELSPYQVLGGLVALGSRAESVSELDLEGAETWTPEDRHKRGQLLTDLAERMAGMGLAADHPWRGVGRDSVLQIDLAPLLQRVGTTADHLEEVRRAGAALAELLGVPPPETVETIENLCRMADQIARAPEVDRQALCHGIWKAGWEGLRDLIAHGRLLDQLRRELQKDVTEAIWEKDYESVRSAFAAHGRSWLRFLNGDYRRAMATVRGDLKGTLPGGAEARLAWVDRVVSGQRARKKILAGDTLGTAAFGVYWRQDQSNWDQLALVLDWVEGQRAAGLQDGFLRLFAGLDSSDRVGPLGRDVQKALARFEESRAPLFQELELDISSAFGVDGAGQIPLSQLADRFQAWRSYPEELSLWTQFHRRRQDALELGLQPLVEGLISGRIAPDEAGAAFERACLYRILRVLTRECPELARFDGESHQKSVEEFRKLDLERIALAKQILLAEHYERLPNASSAVGAVGILNSELERKRGHRPIRQLLRDAGTVVQAIKPVFMMSPLSVAQFIEPGALDFDLLVIDEASQVEPVDAFGAIARSRQMVVVGDSRQLPPTRFFARLTGETSDQDPDATGMAQAQDIESVLGMCCARGMPQMMLRWHYRSRHHSLIAVSNHEFYENRLFIIPSPHANTPELGLQFRHVPEGVFDSGGEGVNREEARVIGLAVLDHVREYPNLSLGVAAFSVRQQQAILDEVEQLRRNHPDIETFFHQHTEEPFFVKNLENVQGDERDVIFISIGYGRDSQGRLAMRFGPLNQEGGERRLNVLMTRAKRRCLVFSSIVAADIDTTRTASRGVRALKTFLEFAQTGTLPSQLRIGSDSLSAFEQAVRQQLEAVGHEVHSGVGVAGFFIDLAVLDPDSSDRYLIGIECDGPSYRSARSARDRDRLRQAVLEDHGWQIHRVWITDWFQRPAEQFQRLLDAVDRAARRRARGTTSPASAEGRVSREPAPIARGPETVREEGIVPSISEPYTMAAFKIPRSVDFTSWNPNDMARVVQRIVEVEGPVHRDEVLLRLRDLLSLTRTPPRFQEALAAALQILVQEGICEMEDAWVALSGRPVPVRSRESVMSSGLRKPDMLPPAEIREAILRLIDEAHGVAAEQLPVAVARVLGLKTTPPVLRQRVQDQLDQLIARETVEELRGLMQRKES